MSFFGSLFLCATCYQGPAIGEQLKPFESPECQQKEISSSRKYHQHASRRADQARDIRLSWRALSRRALSTSAVDPTSYSAGLLTTLFTMLRTPPHSVLT